MPVTTYSAKRPKLKVFDGDEKWSLGEIYQAATTWLAEREGKIKILCVQGDEETVAVLYYKIEDED